MSPIITAMYVYELESALRTQSGGLIHTGEYGRASPGTRYEPGQMGGKMLQMCPKYDITTSLLHCSTSTRWPYCLLPQTKERSAQASPTAQGKSSCSGNKAFTQLKEMF